MQIAQSKEQEKSLLYLLFIILSALFIYGCQTSVGNEGSYQQPPQTLPVITLTNRPATIYQEYSASLEGSKDIEIRPQVDGYLDRIYVDEGAYVKRGQPFFHIDGRTYVEQLNTAKANLAAAKANLANAQINLNKITPLVQEQCCIGCAVKICSGCL